MYFPDFSEPGFYVGFSKKAHQTQVNQSCPCLPILFNKNYKSMSQLSFHFAPLYIWTGQSLVSDFMYLKLFQNLTCFI